MHSWEDFASGRKRAGTISPIPERLVFMPKRKINYPAACGAVSKKVYESFS
jgi:hypothetical protein